MATYANGIPSWVDLGSPDPDASAAFYGDLFGWTTTEPGPVEETGGYADRERAARAALAVLQL